MKKYVIYKMANNSIVRLTDDEPDFKTMKEDEDFDTVERWMSVDSGKEAIEAYLKGSSTEQVVKPQAKVIGEDGNVFVLMGICSKALKRANQADKAKEMSEKIFNAGDYDESLRIMGEYCELV